MMATICKLEKSVLVALGNKEAGLQQSTIGWNIGMYAANYKLEQATLKAMKNKKARAQKNNDGDTIESLYQKYFGKKLVY